MDKKKQFTCTYSFSIEVRAYILKLTNLKYGRRPQFCENAKGHKLSFAAAGSFAIHEKTKR
jgi:hypothetical protein